MGFAAADHSQGGESRHAVAKLLKRKVFSRLTSPGRNRSRSLPAHQQVQDPLGCNLAVDKNMNMAGLDVAQTAVSQS